MLKILTGLAKFSGVRWRTLAPEAGQRGGAGG